MSQLVTVVLLAILGWFAWKFWQRERARVAELLRRRVAPVERQQRSAEPQVTTLEKDPRTGVYRPKDGKGR